MSLKPTTFTTEVYHFAVAKRKEIEAKLQSYQQAIIELKQELIEVDKLLKEYKPKTSLPVVLKPHMIFGGGVSVEIWKLEHYQTLKSWAAKVLFVLTDKNAGLLKGEIYDELVKYEKEEKEPRIIQKRIGSALWSLFNDNLITKEPTQQGLRYIIKQK